MPQPAGLAELVLGDRNWPSVTRSGSRCPQTFLGRCLNLQFYISREDKKISLRHIDMAPRARKKAKNSTIASEDVVLKALVGMPMDIIFEVRQII